MAKKAAAPKKEAAPKKAKHFIRGIYLGPSIGVCKPGDECTEAHLSAMSSDEISKHVE